MARFLSHRRCSGAALQMVNIGDRRGNDEDDDNDAKGHYWAFHIERTT